MQKEEHFGFVFFLVFFLAIFSHNNFSLFIAFLLLQVIIILTLSRISHHNMFIGSNVWCPRQHRNPQFTGSLSLQWALKDVPIDLMKFLSGLWADLSGSLSCGLPEVQAKVPNWTCPKLRALCACLILFNLCVLCTDCVYTWEELWL